jgi:hypothetical protein
MGLLAATDVHQEFVAVRTSAVACFLLSTGFLGDLIGRCGRPRRTAGPGRVGSGCRRSLAFDGLGERVLHGIYGHDVSPVMGLLFLACREASLRTRTRRG